MGAYILSLDVKKEMRSAWFNDTIKVTFLACGCPSYLSLLKGEDRRQAYQEYMECCGFDTLTDSQPDTDCIQGFTRTCVKATKVFISLIASR